MSKEYTVYFEGKTLVEANSDTEAMGIAYDRLAHEGAFEFTLTASEEGECATCGGTKEVATDEEDGEGHTMRGVGRAPCPDCRVKKDEEDDTRDR